MAINWQPHHIGTTTRTFEVEAEYDANTRVEIWSYIWTSGKKYYFKVLKFDRIDNVMIKNKIEQVLDINEGFASLKKCQDFVEKLLRQD